MNARTTVPAFLLGAAVLAGVAWATLSLRGGGAAALRGAGLGVLLGAGGLALEALLVHRALGQPRGQALRIVLGGFLARLVLLAGVSLALSAGTFADAPSFALCFLGGFLASLPFLAVVLQRDAAAGPGGARG